MYKRQEYLGNEVRIGLTAPTEAKLHQRADFGWGEIEYHFMNTGVPHAVLFVGNAGEAEVVTQGRAIRRSPVFPNGTNVNFVPVSYTHLGLAPSADRDLSALGD